MLPKAWEKQEAWGSGLQTWAQVDLATAPAHPYELWWCFSIPWSKVCLLPKEVSDWENIEYMLESSSELSQPHRTAWIPLCPSLHCCLSALDSSAWSPAPLPTHMPQGISLLWGSVPHLTLAVPFVSCPHCERKRKRRKGILLVHVR